MSQDGPVMGGTPREAGRGQRAISRWPMPFVVLPAPSTPVVVALRKRGCALPVARFPRLTVFDRVLLSEPHDPLSPAARRSSGHVSCTVLTHLAAWQYR
jgi:hypothetical protein